MTFAEKFKAVRMQAGLSQDKLSTELGISKRTIVNYEKGETLPTSDKLLMIARYFGVSIESLISENEEFVASAYEQGGSKGAKEAATLVDEISGLFAGGRISEDEKDAVMRALQDAYWIAKAESKKYKPKKFHAQTHGE